jgi:large subunit ribosomal protein L9
VEVVLRQDVEHVGLRGDVVNVARGYARNYLLPRGLAEIATPGLKRDLERREATKARNEAKTTGEAEAIAKRLEATELTFEVNAGPTGSLFGSVTATNIVDRLWDEQKIRLDRRKLGVHTIKRVGRYAVPIEVFTDVTAELRILVVPEGGELPPEEPEPTETPPAASATEPAEAPAEGAATSGAAPEEDAVETDAPETDAATTDAVGTDAPEMDVSAAAPPAGGAEPSSEDPDARPTPEAEATPEAEPALLPDEAAPAADDEPV